MVEEGPASPLQPIRQVAERVAPLLAVAVPAERLGTLPVQEGLHGPTRPPVVEDFGFAAGREPVTEFVDDVDLLGSCSRHVCLRSEKPARPEGRCEDKGAGNQCNGTQPDTSSLHSGRLRWLNG